ncbi:hypothetical protein HZS_733 [Henneguya salminicola]|nr:hypothetical protein HZS_733 [Henneguya salminicola]
MLVLIHFLYLALISASINSSIQFLSVLIFRLGLKQIGSLNYSLPLRMSHNIPIKNIVPFTIISLIAYNSWEAYCSPHEYKRFFYKLRNIFQPSKDLNYNRLVYSKQIELLKVDALRNMQIEKQRNGLVIIRAFYGSYESQ